jgi:non-canonical poly(A) RNA polymerase PAPD5/7
MVKKCPKTNKEKSSSTLGNPSSLKNIDSSNISDIDSLNTIKEVKERRNNTNLDIKPRKIRIRKKLKKIKRTNVNKLIQKLKGKINSYYSRLNLMKDINTKPEWMKEETEKIEDVYMRFNQEILDYIDYITPKGWTNAKREITIDKLKQIIKSYNPNLNVILFGSYYQNTSTIFSDIDFTIIDNNSYISYEIGELYNLMKVLKFNGFSDDIELIDAKVPILKGTNSLTGIKFDISFNRLNGFEDSLLIKKIIEKHPIIRRAIIILKILLKINDLNEPYHGGMSSFLLFHLVYFFHLIFEDEINNNNDNILDFLLSFFKFYGTNFNFDILGMRLSENNEIKTFYKYLDYYMNSYDNICVENINNKHANVGQSCFNYQSVLSLFRRAYNKIMDEKERNSLSVLNNLGFPSQL